MYFQIQNYLIFVVKNGPQQHLLIQPLYVRGGDKLVDIRGFSDYDSTLPFSDNLQVCPPFYQIDILITPACRAAAVKFLTTFFSLIPR